MPDEIELLQAYGEAEPVRAELLCYAASSGWQMRTSCAERITKEERYNSMSDYLKAADSIESWVREDEQLRIRHDRYEAALKELAKYGGPVGKTARAALNYNSLQAGARRPSDGNSGLNGDNEPRPAIVENVSSTQVDE